MRKILTAIAYLFFSTCGSEYALLGIKDKKRDCYAALPAKEKDLIEAAAARNVVARDEAIAAERTRLGVIPLPPSILFPGQGTLFDAIKPEVDPYPESIVAVGEPYDVRSVGYYVNHGKMGKTTVYETSPNSGQYFIVDAVGGDGIGGNGRAVVAEEVQWGLLDNPTNLEGQSWHSWHVGTDNLLVRAEQAPIDDKLGTVKLCGCGALTEAKKASGLAADESASVAPQRFTIAIFLLPGDALPTIAPTGTFSAAYQRSYYGRRYVPKDGHRCVDQRPVC